MLVNNNISSPLQDSMAQTMSQTIIQRVHQNDATTTYKLALLRALVDIALDQPHYANSTEGDLVQIPYNAIADLWMGYYYPLLAKGIPQLQAGRVPAFTETLLRTARKCGVECSDDFYRKPGKVSELRKEIRETLHKGPVAYGGFKEYKLPDGRYADGIVLQGDFWRELVLIGHAVRGQLLLEWVNVCVNLTTTSEENKDKRKLEFMPYLQTTRAPERFDIAAKELFLGQEKNLCVWSGTEINKEELVVDRIIPFDEWSINSWWNFMPTSISTQQQKVDAIITDENLVKAKERIFAQWDIAHKANTQVFELEVQRDFMGKVKADQTHLLNWTLELKEQLFTQLRGRIDFMCAQRSLKRW